MKTLFITHHYLTAKGGGSFASRAYINAFAELSSEMTLMYPVKDGENLFDAINPKIHTIPVAYTVPKLIKFWHLLTGKVHRFYKPALQISKTEHFDLVVFDTSMVSYKLIDVFKRVGSKVVVIHHNYQYEYFRDNTSFLMKIPTLFWCRHYEGEAVKKADLNLTLTSQDIRLLSDRYNDGKDDNFRLLGTFEFKRESIRYLDDSKINVSRFVITGNLRDYQTKESIVPWLRDYYPILKEVFPDAALSIAGRNPDQELYDICRKKGINLIPSPDSMDPIMKDADYYICPVSMGGGLKLRVMDGLKWGLPVVAHKVSARGYDSFVERGYVFVYGDSDEFRHALISLRSVNCSQSEIVRYYYSVFSFQSGTERLRSILF